MHLTSPRSLPHPPSRTSGRAIVACLAAIAAWALGTAPASADVTTLENATAPIVRINIRSGNVAIRTWNRASVEIVGDPGLSIVRRMTHQPVEQAPMLIPQARALDRMRFATLAPESFVVSSIPPGPRETVVIKSTPHAQHGPVIVTVPSDAVFVFAYARRGNLDVRDYRGGTFVGFTNRGRLQLQHVGGTVFAQTNEGRLDVIDSSTERLRARSLQGNITFERCDARQIEASSVDGSIVYDDGTFEPGLARFESTHGNVAIGTQSAAELGAHVGGNGRVYMNFERGARISGSRDEANAIVGGGGPVVTATTQTGNVYLFDGSLRTRERLPAPWQHPLAALPRRIVRRENFPEELPVRSYVPQRTLETQRPNEPDLAFPLPHPIVTGHEVVRTRTKSPSPAPQRRR